MVTRTKSFAVFCVLLVLLAASSCLPKPPAESGGINITLYGFSIMKESLGKGHLSRVRHKVEIGAWPGREIHFVVRRLRNGY